MFKRIKNYCFVVAAIGFLQETGIALLDFLSILTVAIDTGLTTFQHEDCFSQYGRSGLWCCLRALSGSPLAIALAELSAHGRRMSRRWPRDR